MLKHFPLRVNIEKSFTVASLLAPVNVELQARSQRCTSGGHTFQIHTPGAPQVHAASYIPNTDSRGATSSCGRSYLHNAEGVTSTVSQRIVYIFSTVSLIKTNK